MQLDEFIECRDCHQEFDPDDRYHAEVGYRNQCGDCARKLKSDVPKVRAFTEFNKDGDWQGIEVVSASEYDKYQRVVKQYAEREFTSPDRETED